MALDFKGVAAAALRDSHHLVAAWLRDGRIENREWVAANPNRPSSGGGGAFRVNLDTGKWADFALKDTGQDVGGLDLISLYAYLKGVGNGVACREIAAELHIDAGDGTPPMRVVGGTKNAPTAPAALPKVGGGDEVLFGGRRPPPRDIDGELLTPVPPDAPPFEASGALTLRGFGDATAWWPYHDAAGGLLMYVARYADEAKGPGEKQFRPWTLWRSSSGRLVWRPKTLAEPRPFYRLHEVTRRREATIVICEGEKAADGAQLLLPDHVATTTLNGAKSPDKSDWSPVGGRRVLVWPDHDAAGIGYTNKVVALARDAGAADVRVLSFGWVAAVLAGCRSTEGAA
jgi:putative DNA primase/helicase